MEVEEIRGRLFEEEEEEDMVGELRRRREAGGRREGDLERKDNARPKSCKDEHTNSVSRGEDTRVLMALRRMNELGDLVGKKWSGGNLFS